MERRDYLKLTEAAKEYGVSRNKLWLLVREGKLRPYEDPKDRRATLLKREEIESVLQVRPKGNLGEA